MQHFYNTHIFKSSIESCRDEGIHCEVEVDYVDNVPCIDLISSLVCDICYVESTVSFKWVVPHLVEHGRSMKNSGSCIRSGVLSWFDVWWVNLTQLN